MTEVKSFTALPKEPAQPAGSVKTLEEVMEVGVNGVEEEVQEWEGIEFLVVSGASMTVIGEEMVKAVAASSVCPSTVMYQVKIESGAA